MSKKISRRCLFGAAAAAATLPLVAAAATLPLVAASSNDDGLPFTPAEYIREVEKLGWRLAVNGLKDKKAWANIPGLFVFPPNNIDELDRRDPAVEARFYRFNTLTQRALDELPAWSVSRLLLEMGREGRPLGWNEPPRLYWTL
ncbi:hypothetical protein [Methyloceanibacter sp.]|uniref:hypothetical protein n=1 Tax=Methyloceanibacter sp. TaxID=1965321 RepID=UPI002C6ED1AE|nr:hypothetical protein [Methyloceanibacter sp.]HML92214.1 hypothetical protein [Methyloceanibacter sp.]